MKELEKTEYYKMSFSELDELIKEYLGFNPESVACWEVGNDSYKVMMVFKSLNDYEEKDLKLLLEDGEQYGHKVRNEYSAPCLCMVELCRRGIIPEGNYLISICW